MDQLMLSITPLIVANWIKEHLQNFLSQPTAGELLAKLEEKFE